MKDVAFLIPKADADFAGVVDELALGRDSADPSDGLGDRHATDLVVLVADHVAELLLLSSICRILLGTVRS